MKFFNLLKKELKEMLNKNMIVSMVVSFALLVMLGQLTSSSMDSITHEDTNVSICDLDDTDFTKKILSSLQDYGYSIDMVSATDTDDDISIINSSQKSSILVIPKGFTDSIDSKTLASIKCIGTVNGTSVMSQIQNSISSGAISDISEIVKRLVLQEQSSITTTELDYLDNPITLDNVTVVGDKSENVSANDISSLISSQGTFVPIIIFVIIVFASQMIVTAISTEKIDKTLETLLSTPISRVSILSAKMLSAGIVSLLSAIVYMIGFSVSMGSMMSGLNSTGTLAEVTSSVLPTSIALVRLGLSISPIGYILIGIQIFLSIMIALSLSIMLGVMVTDIKSTQLVMMPVMFMALIPYLISMFVDTSTLSPIAKTIMYLIPFTHTFNATNNIMFGNTAQYWIGVVYQLVFLVVCMFFAVKLFKSDKILTASLNFKTKKKF